MCENAIIPEGDMEAEGEEMPKTKVKAHKRAKPGGTYKTQKVKSHTKKTPSYRRTSSQKTKTKGIKRR